MFRTVALMVRRSGISLDDENALGNLCGTVDISFRRSYEGKYLVFSDGEDVSDAIRTPEISLLTSCISARKIVRERLLDLQRKIGAVGGVVLEGRDIGTVVFPNAEVKFFLSATPEERGKRRYLELLDKGENTTLERTIQEVVQRDAQDQQREHAPLKKAGDAIEVDTTSLSIEEVLDLMENIVLDKMERSLGKDSGV
jgi:cytidylate kinase